MAHPFPRPQRKPARPGFAGMPFSCLAWLLLLAVLALAAGCGAPKLPPITAAPTNQHLPGKVVWHDLLTPDLAGAKRFYGAVFGWTFKDQGDYALALRGDVPVAGLAADPKKDDGKQIPSWWLMSLSVSDVDQAAAVALKEGGKVIKGPGEITGRGSYAVVADPQGAPLVLLRASGGDPADGALAINGWLWNELWSADPPSARAFYSNLAGLDAAQAPSGADGEYWVLGRDGKWRLGVTGLPLKTLRSQWVPCIRVADLAETLDKIAANGGLVIVRPEHALSPGAVAVVRDPWGALFMVGTWPDQAGAKEQAQ